MHNKKRIHRIKTEPKGNNSFTKPFQQSISSILIDKCQKCTQQLQKNNLKAAKEALLSLEKDMVLLHPSHTDFARIASLIYNTRAGYYRKNGENQEALKCLDQAIAIERQGNVDRIDMARTILNKSVIMGQMAREDKNLYTHETAIGLAKEALEIIKNRPEGRNFIQKDQYKLGQLIIISFHNIATQLVCLKNEQQGYNLYKKAHDLALRVLGPRNNLTIHLKNIIGRMKQQKNLKKKLLTEQGSSPQLKNNKSKTINNNSEIHKSKKKTNYILENKKFKSFFKIYGYSKDKSFMEDSHDQITLQQSKPDKFFNPNKTTNLFPHLKRKSIRDIISEGRQLAAKRPHVTSVNQREKPLTTNDRKSSNNPSRTSSFKKMQHLKTEEVKVSLPIKQNDQLQQLLRKKLDEKNKEETKQVVKGEEKQKKVEEGGCQLI